MCLAAFLAFCSQLWASDFFALCLEGKVEQVRQALENGADVNVRDSDGYTPLMLAVGAKHGTNPNAEITRLLIHHGTDVRAEYKDKKFARLSEKHTVDTMTALHWAVLKCPEVIPDLLDAGADINAPGSFIGTPLMIAVTKSKEYPEVVSLLIQRDADVNVEYGSFGTAISVALSLVGVLRGVSSTVAQELLDAGADVGYVNPTGATMLICTMDGDNRDSHKIVQTILDAGVDVNAADENGTTALMMAVLRGASVETLHMLLKAGADADKIRDLNGFTAYQHARYSRNSNMDKANVIFYKGRRSQLLIAKTVFVTLLVLPVLLLIGLLVRCFVLNVAVRKREIAGAVFFVTSNTLLPLFFAPLLPLPYIIHILSFSFLVISAVSTISVWRKRRNISRLEFYSPPVLLVLMCASLFWTIGVWRL
jgi:ankyrin repeat protein